MRNIVLTMLVVLLLNNVFANTVYPNQLIEKYKSNRDSLRIYITKSEQLVEIIDTAERDNVKWMRNICEFRTDGERVDLILENHFELASPVAEARSEYSSQKRVIWNGDRWFDYNFRTHAFVSDSVQQRDLFISTGYSGAVLDGIFFGDRQSIDVILERATNIMVMPQMEKVNGVACYVLSAITPNGKYHLWIDPEHGYNIARAEVHKSGSDLLYGRPINQDFESEVKKNAVSDGIKTRLTQEFLFTFDEVRFQKFDNTWVPVEAVYQHTTKYNDGRTINEKKHHKRTHFDPKPNFEAISAFIPDIPNGTEVYLEWASGIRYIWNDGEFSTDIDDSYIEQLGDVAEQIKHEMKPDIVRTANQITQDSDKEMPAAIDKSTATHNVENAEQKNTTAVFSFSVIAFTLVGIIVVGCGVWLALRSVKKGNRC